MISAAAPGSTANLGPGFDAAAAALDLWNTVELEEGAFCVEIEGEGAGELPRDASHLALRAFALFAQPDRYRFRFANRIPLERGLGSSAAAIALGLVAGATAAGADPSRDELLALAAELEQHADNLAAALGGGVCVTWREGDVQRSARVADGMPAAPVAVVPGARTSTAASRAALPESVPHRDAAETAGAAVLLGAAVAGGDAGLLHAAFRDRLHEPYRLAAAPLLAEVRRIRHPALLGVTLSGSGPSVIAWAEPAHAEAVAAELRAAAAPAEVLLLQVTAKGARASTS
ncbi:MAG TPA: homoserine kinase [Gaiellaceae bacterium]|nr:homoserine kinase [Gaiellaceae bacterium]